MNPIYLVFLSLISILGILSFVAYWLPQTIIPIIIKNSDRWNIMDEPTSRKVHIQPIPRLGGLSIAPALWLSCSLCFIVCQAWPELFGTESSLNLSPIFLGLFLGSLGMFIIGAIDDTIRLRARHKFLGQFIVVTLCIAFLPLPDSLMGIHLNSWIMRPLMAIWLVIIPNSVNLLDGIDGLTATLGLIFATMISMIAISSGEFLWLFATFPLSLSLLSFLKFNWHPGKIFLGDSGSLLIGFWVAYASLYFSFNKDGAATNWNPWISLGLTTIWVIDTVWAIGRRYFSKAPSRQLLFRRSKKTYLGLMKNALWNIVNADDNHIHHRLLKAGFRVPQAVAIIAATANIFFLFSVSLKLFINRNASIYDFRFYTPVIFVGLAASTTVFLRAVLYPRQKPALFIPSPSISSFAIPPPAQESFRQQIEH